MRSCDMIHRCELLGFMPTDMLFEVAPHLWGRTQEEAEDRRTLTKLIERLPQDKRSHSAPATHGAGGKDRRCCGLIAGA